MAPRIIGPEVEADLDWLALTEALAEGHALPRAEIDDTFLYRGADTLLSRAAWIDGLGALVKTAMIFPGNAPPLRAVNGAASLFSDRDGTCAAMVDFHLLTRWKTAGDSLLAARRLAPPDVRRIVILGAGAVARSMVSAYGAAFPQARISVWNRTASRLQAPAFAACEVVSDLPSAVAAADIVCTATMSSTPVVQGEWLSPGTHLDLIGAFRPDMREVDDTALRRARLFVDSRATTLGHIGEMKIPLATGVISEDDIVADFYELAQFVRRDPEEITIAKNGGGAHLDLMTACYILRVCAG